MHFCFLAFPILALLSSLAASSPAPQAAGSCNGAPPQCCDRIQSTENEGAKNGVALTGLGLTGGVRNVGINCKLMSPKDKCKTEPVCCTGGTVLGGMVTLNCGPVDPAK
ncbi:hypothetical protein AJ80_07740 [Polytolypa hystricis UAMH7299]|uniref:Hydrophobin n=1 Tax=Polytolypa hystricis (strain UAMH7299) TaxID=1447883 RepID=A0A2B7XJR5_POLH7|nr:hypothetical protein AJ80_07740 [Polytolypa hystricis UAMH7299]